MFPWRREVAPSVSPPAITQLLITAAHLLVCVEVCAIQDPIPFTAPQGKQEQKGNSTLIDIFLKYFLNHCEITSR